MDSFEGKVALVTGGASGIGKAAVERLAREGAAVSVVDMNPAGAGVAEAIDGLFCHANVGDLTQMKEAAAATAERFGRLDLVLLNAGVSTGVGDMASMDEAIYRRAIGANVDGVVYGVMAALPHMEAGSGFVATASLAGLVPYPGDPIYGLTKHAVVGFVRAMGPQLAPRGIDVNAVCPGFADTSILGDFADGFRAAGFPLLKPEEVAEAILQIATSGRTGDIFVCQPGRTCELYGFRGVPGPRAPGSEGVPPPFRPGE